MSFATIALGHVRREYPHKLDHVLGSDADALTPSQLHPIFHGSFDWHSCVHGYWLLATLLRRGDAQAPAIRALFDEMLTSEKVAGELGYLDRPESAGFERPYGWAWLLMLDLELSRHDAPWSAALRPLAAAFAARFEAHLPKLTYAIRAGTHFNSAFAVVLAREWAEAFSPPLVALIDARALDWFGRDRDAEAWEPSGDDFLSPTLVEALLMRRVLGDGFRPWLIGFLPRLGAREPATLFAPAAVSDRSDGKIAHLDGLNLSRAWCWRGIADACPDPAAARATADTHEASALPHLAGDYAGEHWLATFALLAELAR